MSKIKAFDIRQIDTLTQAFFDGMDGKGFYVISGSENGKGGEKTVLWQPGNGYKQALDSGKLPGRLFAQNGGPSFVDASRVMKEPELRFYRFKVLSRLPGNYMETVPL